jgi:hypothetical protein
MPFPCSKCGECCRHINKVPQLAEFDTGNGVCVHLKDNKCDIYDYRPEICNVDLMYEKYFSERFGIEEFYEMNEDVCRELASKNIKKF